SEHSTPVSAPPGDIFATTHWTVVLAARSTPQSDAALEQLCRAYWFPLYAYARRRGCGKEDAEDLTQEFFRQLLERRWLADADRTKGRLRAFLITAFKRFMAKEWRRAGAQKRGGGRIQLPLDTVFAESRYAADATPQLAAEAMFDRQWALTLLDLTIRKLEAEFAGAGRSGEFEVLKHCLVAAHRAIDYDAVAAGLGVGAGAARVAAHRLRKRFRELYRREVLQTLPPGADLEDELRHLANCLAAA
ncbi:MAG TPA: sigma factor, partial [Verrucomicrobiae bacterium]|nr:sigma factor [Verrucomicrobiae bacterium]